MYKQFMEMAVIENELMELYEQKFNINPRTDKSYKLFTEEEQIERYAQNIDFFGENLLQEYTNIDIVEREKYKDIDI